MGLEVNLKEFGLGEVLQFLARVKKNGLLRISGKVSGEIYLKDGLVVHANDGTQKGLEALFNLCFIDLEKGSFEIGVNPPEQTISLEVGKLSEDIEKRRIELDDIRKNLPPIDTILAKSQKELQAVVALRRTDWQILALIDGQKKLSEVVAASKLGAFEATKIIAWLKEQCLIYEPKETERVTAELTLYLNILFENFGKNGLVWLKRWEGLSPENRETVQALVIDEESLKVRSKSALNPGTIEKFLKDFETFMDNEGPKIYGRILFKKKLDDFKQKILSKVKVG